MSPRIIQAVDYLLTFVVFPAILVRPVSLLTNCIFTATRDKGALHVIDKIFQMKVSLLKNNSGTNLCQLL